MKRETERSPPETRGRGRCRHVYFHTHITQLSFFFFFWFFLSPNLAAYTSTARTEPDSKHDAQIAQRLSTFAHRHGPGDGKDGAARCCYPRTGGGCSSSLSSSLSSFLPPCLASSCPTPFQLVIFPLPLSRYLLGYGMGLSSPPQDIPMKAVCDT